MEDLTKLKELDWKNYFVIRTNFDDDDYVLQGTVDRKSAVLLKLMAAYNQERWCFNALKAEIVKFNETVGTHNFVTFLLWFSKQPNYEDVIKSLVEGTMGLQARRFDSMAELMQYLQRTPNVLGSVPTILVPDATEYTNGDRHAAMYLDVAHDEAGTIVKKSTMFNDYKLRAALANLTEITPLTINDLCDVVCKRYPELGDTEYVQDYLYMLIEKQYDITMKYNNLSEVFEKKLLAF